MGYHVWYEEYAESWRRTYCETLADAKSAILDALQAGKEPLLTQDVTYEINLIIKEGASPSPKKPAKLEETAATIPTEEVKVEVTEDTPEPSKRSRN